VLLALYVAAISLLVEVAGHERPERPVNEYYEVALNFAPWHSQAKADYASYLRNYALQNAKGEAQSKALNKGLALVESAMQLRPLWPYYHLSALDIEYLLGSSSQTIQSRFDKIVQLAPNERGLDRNFLKLSMFVWNDLRSDQKAWVGSRLITMSKWTRPDVLETLSELKVHNPRLCTQLPWKLVKRACQE
jgi:hypothetical protein